MEVNAILSNPNTALKAPETTMPEIVFVGHQCNFSQSLITATTQELGYTVSKVLSSFNDMYKLVSQKGGDPTVLVMDEPTLRDLQDRDRQFLLELGDNVAIGLAFGSVAFGVACYNDPALRTRSISIFPINVRLDVWLSIVRLISHGGSYVCPDVIAEQASDMRHDPNEDICLTQRQIDVLRLVADGQPNKRIADQLGLSVHTVKLHLHNACLRLGARNRTEAAMRFRASRL